MKNQETDIKSMFDAGRESLTDDELLEIDAGVLALKFIGILDEEMESKGVSKKQLAERIGTSPSFVTQVFRGNRKPNWDFLAKAQRAMNMRFEVSTKAKLDDWITDEIQDYHSRWVKSKSNSVKTDGAPIKALLTVEDEPDYALAG